MAEVDALTESEAIRLAFPATPESLQDDEEGRPRVYDLLLFVEQSVSAVAYKESDGGWTEVATEGGEDPYETVYDALLEYRGYEIEREDAVRKIVTEMYGITEVIEEMDEFEDF